VYHSFSKGRPICNSSFEGLAISKAVLSRKAPGEIWRNVESQMAGYGEMLFFENQERLITERLVAHSGKSSRLFCLGMMKTARLFAPRIRQLFLPR
jgi:hypothetical protein